MIEDACRLSAILNEEQDRLPRVLHEQYLIAERLKSGFGSKPSHKPWQELAENLKDSNRQAADHIPIKLRALGLHTEPKKAGATPSNAVLFGVRCIIKGPSIAGRARNLLGRSLSGLHTCNTVSSPRKCFEIRIAAAPPPQAHTIDFPISRSSLSSNVAGFAYDVL